MSDKKNNFPKREERIMYGDNQPQTKNSRDTQPSPRQNTGQAPQQEMQPRNETMPQQRPQQRQPQRPQQPRKTAKKFQNNKQASQQIEFQQQQIEFQKQQQQFQKQQLEFQQKQQKPKISPQELSQNISSQMKKQVSKSKSTLKKLNLPKVNLTFKQKAIILGVILLILTVHLLTRKNGTEVFIDETSYGILYSTSMTVEELSLMVYEQLEQEIGAEVKINETITLNKLRVNSSRKKDYCTLEYLVPQIRHGVSFDVNSANIMIDGKLSVSLATTEEANSVLESIQSKFVPEGIMDIEVGFVEDVVVDTAFVSQQTLMSVAEATMFLESMDFVTGEYTIASGDTWFGLALRYDVKVDEIFKYNESKNINVYPIVGEVINVPISKPKLSVKTLENQVVTTTEPKDTVYEYDSSLSKDYQKVQQQGRAGQKESTIQITRINGFVESEVEISKVITVEPITEIIVKGTQ